MQRLDKIISSQMNISRSNARSDIRRGKVSVDGIIIRDPSFGAEAGRQEIYYCGQAVNYRKFIYIAANKPKGVLSASSDKSRTTIIDLVPDSLRRSGLSPAGRLDKDTTGLLLITDDGGFAHRVISPKSGIFKTYEAVLDGEITEDIIKSFESGVTLADGTKCAPAELTKISGRTVQVRISEGKYHQIKRMFGVFSLGVNELKRTAVGAFTLPDALKPGEFREITDQEKRLIFEKP